MKREREMEDGWPIAWVTAVIPVKDRLNSVQLLEVGSCPLCGEAHIHGGGTIGEPLALGHRAAHCGKDVEPHGYILRLSSTVKDER